MSAVFFASLSSECGPRGVESKQRGEGDPLALCAEPLKNLFQGVPVQNMSIGISVSENDSGASGFPPPFLPFSPGGWRFSTDRAA